jgi:hypothetical protein
MTWRVVVTVVALVVEVETVLDVVELEASVLTESVLDVVVALLEVSELLEATLDCVAVVVEVTMLVVVVPAELSKIVSVVFSAEEELFESTDGESENMVVFFAGVEDSVFSCKFVEVESTIVDISSALFFSSSISLDVVADSPGVFGEFIEGVSTSSSVADRPVDFSVDFCFLFVSDIVEVLLLAVVLSFGDVDIVEFGRFLWTTSMHDLRPQQRMIFFLCLLAATPAHPTFLNNSFRLYLAIERIQTF